MRIRKLVAAAVAVVALGACTPDEAIWLWFHDLGDHKVREAHLIVQCESGHHPDAVSPGGRDHGLFQINNVHRAEFERVTQVGWEHRYTPYWNAAYARHLYDQRGWQPWTCARKVGLR